MRCRVASPGEHLEMDCASADRAICPGETFLRLSATTLLQSVAGPPAFQDLLPSASAEAREFQTPDESVTDLSAMIRLAAKVPSFRHLLDDSVSMYSVFSS